MSDTIPVSGPAAWVGKEVTRRDDWNFTLSPQHLEELRIAVRQTAAMPLTRIGSAEFSLPTLGQQLLQIQHRLEHESGATIVKGFPVDDFRQKKRSVFSGDFPPISAQRFHKVPPASEFFTCGMKGLRPGTQKLEAPIPASDLVFILIVVTSLDLCACNKLSQVGSISW